MNYFDSDMSKSTNMVVYFDWKTKPIILRSLPVNSPLFTLHAVFILKSIKKKNLDNSGIYFLFFFNNLTIVADKIILRMLKLKTHSGFHELF
jgi:hypothetical protein